MSRRFFQAALVPVFFLALFACKKSAPPPAANPAKLYVVGIFQSVDSPTANEVRRGILKAFEDNGLREGESIQVRIRIAAGDAARPAGPHRRARSRRCRTGARPSAPGA